MNKFFYILFTLLCLPAFAQKRVPLNGRITADNTTVTNAFIINKHLGKETRTDGNGNFTIMARSGDILVVYSKGTELREFYLTEASFKESPYRLEVKPVTIELEEVVISDSIPLSAGFPRMQPKYTPAEAKLKAATDTYHMDQGLMIHGDAIINKLIGRSAALKKALSTERKEATMEAIANDAALVEMIQQDLEIPEEYVRGFLFYLVEDVEFAAALKAKNSDLSKTRLLHLAETYRQNLQSGE